MKGRWNRERADVPHESGHPSMAARVMNLVFRPTLLGAVSGLVVVGLLMVLTGCPSPAPTLPESERPTERGESGKESPAQATAANRSETTESDRATGKVPREDKPGNEGKGGGSTGRTGLESPTDVATATPPTQPRADAHLFQGWPKPDFVVAVTGEQHGYIEPCGCTGLVNQRGGLARRFSFLQSLRERGWNVVPIDTGDQIRRFGIQAEIKFQSTIAGLRKMGYQAISLGPDDLRLSATMLAGLAVPAGNQQPLFFCGSASLFGDESFLPRAKIIEAAGRRVGVISVVAPSRAVEVNSDDVEMTPADQALEAAATSLDGCDWKVLIVQGTREESEQLAKRHDMFQLVICAGEPGEPTREAQPIDGTDAKLILVGYKAMYVGVIGVFGDELRYQRVPLDSRFPDAEPMLQLLADYQNTLKLKGLEGLGVRPVPHPSGNRFVGSDACAECHEEAYEVWKHGVDGKGGPHAHATLSLVRPSERSEIARHYDPECLSCHVTGWRPQEYQPYESGYVSLETSSHLTGNGCENCHGPGSAHVAAENGETDADEAQVEKLRQQLHLVLERAERQCMECHDLDNSPDFHVRGAFQKYWEKIRH